MGRARNACAILGLFSVAIGGASTFFNVFGVHGLLENLFLLIGSALVIISGATSQIKLSRREPQRPKGVFGTLLDLKFLFLVSAISSLGLFIIYVIGPLHPAAPALAVASALGLVVAIVLGSVKVFLRICFNSTL